jgi:hypothetical protein
MIVIYKENEYPIKTLIDNRKYLVRSINGDKVVLFNIRNTFNKSNFTDEDGNIIKTKKYINKFAITRKNIEKGERVLCVDDYGDGMLAVGCVYIVEDIIYYMDKTFKLEIIYDDNYVANNKWVYILSRATEFSPNHFVKFSKESERYLKFLKFFDDIDVLKTNE